MYAGAEHPTFLARFGANFHPIVGNGFVTQIDFFRFFTFFIHKKHLLFDLQPGNDLAFQVGFFAHFQVVDGHKKFGEGWRG